MNDEQVTIIGSGQLAKLMKEQLENADCQYVHIEKDSSNERNGSKYFGNLINIANTSDLILTIQEDIVDLEEILVGKNGVINCSRNENVVLDMSSVSPEYIKEIAEIFLENEKYFLDAAYLDVKDKNDNIVKMLIVGGDEYVFNKAKSLLSLLADNVVHIGEHGASQFYRQAFAVRAITDD